MHLSTKILFILLLALVNARLVDAQNPDVVLTTGHTDQINCLAFSPDGKYIVTGGNDKVCKIWEIRSTKELRALVGFDSRLVAVAFDPSSKYVATLDYGSFAKVWEVATGKLMCSYPASSYTEYIGFCNGGNQVVFIDDASHILCVDFKSDKIVKQIDVEGDPQRMVILPNGKELIYYNFNAELVHFNIESGAEIQRQKIAKEFSYMYTKMSVNRHGDLLALTLADTTLRIYSINGLKELAKFDDHNNIIKDLCFEKAGDGLISTDHNNELFFWDIKNKKLAKKGVQTTFGIVAMDTHPFEKFIVYSEFKSVHYVDPQKMEILKDFNAMGNRIVSMSYDQHGKYLATASDDISIKLWDLQALKIDRKLSGFFPVEFSPTGDAFACMGTPSKLFVYNPHDGKLIKELPTEMELIQNLNYSYDGTKLAGAGFYGIIKIWDVKLGLITHRLKGHVGGVYSTAFSPDGKLLASCGMDNTIRIWDLKSGKEIYQMQEHAIITHDIEFSPDGKLLAVCSWDKTISIWNTNDWSLVRKLEGHVNMITTLNFSADSKYLASGAGNNVVSPMDNSIRVWDVNTGETVCQFHNPSGAINKVIFDKQSNLLFSASDDGIAKIWDVKKCKEVAGLISVLSSDYIIVTPDNYYIASKGSLPAVSFRLDTRLFPFEQFDIRLNRPDIIASRIGKTPTNLVKAFQYVYDKRLKRMNFRKEDLGDEFHVPTISYDAKSIPYVSSSEKIVFSVRMKDDKYPLNRLMVYVNDVPIYGPNGYDLSTINKKDIEMDVKIALVHGNNKVKISVINEKGAASLIEEFGVIRDGNPGKHNLFIVCIGVSDYKDSRFNLNYAAKDAKDVMTRFTQSKDNYANVYSKLLVNADVTKDNILALTDFLASAQPEDLVVVFIAGHGVLDDKFNYYFGTHDLDFAHPENNGITYDAIENLFSYLKAQKKLLIMDTCHSGELDKDEVEESTRPEIEIKEVKFRNVGVALAQKESFGVANTFDLMQMMFADVRGTSGTVVISSAGGAEFAMESDQWKNGLFTYCFLSSAQDWSADINYDKHISVSEIRNYTYDKVYKLSAGRQRPTTRSDNLVLDFWLW